MTLAATLSCSKHVNAIGEPARAVIGAVRTLLRCAVTATAARLRRRFVPASMHINGAPLKRRPLWVAVNDEQIQFV
jgi:hypothetical protein